VLGARKGAADVGPFLYPKNYNAMNNQRKKQLEFNIQNNELHAQVATILNLVREDISLKGWNKKHDKILNGIIRDLMYIHDHCSVLFRSKKMKRTISRKVSK